MSDILSVSMQDILYSREPELREGKIRRPRAVSDFVHEADKAAGCGVDAGVRRPEL